VRSAHLIVGLFTIKTPVSSVPGVFRIISFSDYHLQTTMEAELSSLKDEMKILRGELSRLKGIYQSLQFLNSVILKFNARRSRNSKSSLQIRLLFR
jgi:hypothetical protein